MQYYQIVYILLHIQMSVNFLAIYLARNLSAAIRAALSGDSRRALPCCPAPVGGASPRILLLITLTHSGALLPCNLRRQMRIRTARKVVL